MIGHSGPALCFCCVLYVEHRCMCASFGITSTNLNWHFYSNIRMMTNFYETFFCRFFSFSSLSSVVIWFAIVTKLFSVCRFFPWLLITSSKQGKYALIGKKKHQRCQHWKAQLLWSRFARCFYEFDMAFWKGSRITKKETKREQNTGEHRTKRKKKFQIINETRLQIKW